MKGIKMKRGRKGRVNRLLVALIAVMMVAVYGLAPVQPVTGVAFAEEAWYTMDAYGNVVVKDGTTTIDTTLQCESEVTTVTIPASVTEVEDYAFFGCENLTVVTFKGETPPSIGECAFESQGDAVTVNVPKGCKDEYESALVENYAFTMTDYTVVEAGGGTDPVDPVDPTPAEKEIFTYRTVEGGVAITGLGKDFALSSENRVETITVPDTIGGQPVVGIASGAFKEKFVGTLYGGANSGVRVITVKLPETVQYIDDDAFYGCQGLAAVNMPRDLKRIGERAFYNCKNLVNAEFPAGLEMIEYGAFWNCFALKGNADGIIALPEGAKVQLTGAGQNQDSAFSMCSSVQGYDISNDEFKTDKDGVIFTADGKTLVQYPLGRTTSSYDIPEGTETIGQNAFKWHQSDTKNPNNLKTVTFPNSLKTVEKNAFMCQGLTSVTLPAHINWSDSTGVFQLNKNLETVTICEGVTDIPAMFFYGLDNVKEVNLPSTLRTIGDNAFDRCNLTQIDLPDGLESIGKEAFEGSKLTSVTIPASVKSIGDRAFYRSKDLEAINIEGGKTALDLGKYTFNYCTKLNNVRIPARVTKLDDGIFSCCTALKNIETEAVTELGNSVFASSGLEKISMPDTIKKMGNATFFECGYLKEVTLPANLEELGTCTFEVCSSLTKVTIPDTVKFSVIPEDTFWACSSLKSLTFPESITETKACAFSNCRNLESIEVKNLKKDFKRSDFDCYAINLDGDYSKYGYWVEGVFYLYDDATISDIAGDQDNSGGAIGELEKVNNAGEELDAAASGATLATADAGSTELLCGCSVGGGGQFAATANPKFNYKTASSNTAAIGGNAAGNAAKAAGGNGGSPVTGDEASLLIFALLAMVSGTYIFARRQKVK